MSKPRFVPPKRRRCRAATIQTSWGAANGNPSADVGNPDQSGGGAATANTAVTHDGFGKLKVGMTVAQASQALGVAPDRE